LGTFEIGSPESEVGGSRSQAGLGKSVRPYLKNKSKKMEYVTEVIKVLA
jgi:hypothetical protein